MNFTEDTLLAGRVRFLQPSKGFRATLDMLLLAASIEASAKETLCELGAGSGVASLCVAARLPGCSLWLVEKDAGMAALALKNIEIHNRQALAHQNSAEMPERLKVIEADITALPKHLGPFHQVFANPPFYVAGRHRPSELAQRRSAMHADIAGPWPWVKAARRLLRPRGRLTLVDAADRLPELLAALTAEKFSAIEIMPLWPRLGDAAKRILLRARLNRKTPPRLLAGHVLHEEFEYTNEIKDVIAGGALAWR